MDTLPRESPQGQSSRQEPLTKQELFSDTSESDLHHYLEKALYPKGVPCPFCAHPTTRFVPKDFRYRCDNCNRDTSLKSNTFLRSSCVTLRDWIYFLYLLQITPDDLLTIKYLSQKLHRTRNTTALMICRIKLAFSDLPLSTATWVKSLQANLRQVYPA